MAIATLVFIVPLSSGETPRAQNAPAESTVVPTTSGSRGSSLGPTLRTLVVGSALTAIAFRYDQRMHRTMLERDWLEFRGIDVGDFYGGGVFLGSVSVAAWGLGALTHSRDLHETGTVMMKALALDFVLTTGLKYTVRRERPDHSDHHSFPSGHASFAFAGSTVLARRYGWRVAVPAYALALTTVVARMEDNKHYLSDVVAGATLGMAVGCLVTSQSSRGKPRLTVHASRDGIGLGLLF